MFAQDLPQLFITDVQIQETPPFVAGSIVHVSANIENASTDLVDGLTVRAYASDHVDSDGLPISVFDDRVIEHFNLAP